MDQNISVFPDFSVAILVFIFSFNISKITVKVKRELKSLTNNKLERNLQRLGSVHPQNSIPFLILLNAQQILQFISGRRNVELVVEQLVEHDRQSRVGNVVRSRRRPVLVFCHVDHSKVKTKLYPGLQLLVCNFGSGIYYYIVWSFYLKG